MFNWLNLSITRKISGLSTILLSFLFIIILYSVFKLHNIDKEMREVAEIDIPLTEVMSEIELLQLRQHLLMEMLKQKNPQAFSKHTSHSQLSAEFDEYNRHLSAEMDKAVNIIQTGLTKGRIRLKVDEHRSVVQSMHELHASRLQFEKAFTDAITDILNDRNQSWQQLEQQDDLLDNQVSKLLANLSELTVEIVEYAEKHEYEFIIVNGVLGLSALGMGVYLSAHIIRTFRKRMKRIHGQLQQLQHSIYNESPVELKTIDAGRDRDELIALEASLKIILSRLSDEMDNRQEVEQQLIELATKDKLTGAYNRHKWDEQLQVELRLASRGTQLSLLLLDADHFKRVNDTFGHHIGDKVLQALVIQLKNRLRESDLLFRLGGEEFAILLRHINVSEAQKVAEALRQTAENFQEEGLPAFTVSFGISTYNQGDDADSILKRADIALYKAKQNGRNRIEVAL